MRSASQSKRSELAPLTSQAPAPGIQCSLREILSPWVARSIKESNVVKSHRLDR